MEHIDNKTFAYLLKSRRRRRLAEVLIVAVIDFFCGERGKTKRLREMCERLKNPILSPGENAKSIREG